MRPLAVMGAVCALTTFSGLGWATALSPIPKAPLLSGSPVVPVAPVPTPTPPLADSAYGPASTSRFGAMSYAAPALPSSAGRTPGSFAVSNSGAAIYTIPLWTAPGVGAVELDLALVYNSRSPNGVLGAGWSLAGLSAISRCNKTWAQDGAPAAVTLTYSDRYCLDGQQLKLVSGVPGQSGSVYATEIESFSKIVSNGAVGNGPASFTVTTKNGLIYDYGLTGDAQILAGSSGTIRTWALSKIRDRVGNAISLTYTNDTANGSYRIASITYPTTATGQGPFYQVVFGYAARPANDVVSGYVAGYATREPNQLDSIRIQNFGSGSPTKTYYLGYDQGPTTNRLRLKSVQECSASACLAATSVAYQAGQAGWPTAATALGQQTADAARVIAADLNGDGVSDLVYPMTSGSSYTWRVMFGSASGAFGAPQSLGITTGSNDTLVAAAFSGRGRTELLYPSGGYWYWGYWNGASFTTASTGTPVLGPDGSTWKSIAADVNGDGLPDLIWVANGYTRPDSTIIYGNFNATPAGGNVAFGTATPLYEFPSSQTATWTVLQGGVYGGGGASAITTADFNGDSRADLMVLVKSTSYSGCLLDKVIAPGIDAAGGAQVPTACTQSSFSYWQQMISTGNAFTAGPGQFSGVSSSEVNALDWDGDGCTDVAIAGYGSSTNWTVYRSACGGSGQFQAGIDTGLRNNQLTLAVDWDSDGRQDLLGANGTWRVARSTGVGVAAPLDTGVAVGSGAWFAGDFNGDGLSDLGWTDKAASKALKVNLHQGSGQPPDLATSFSDGFGMSQSPTYASIARGSYSRYADAPFPWVDYQGPLYVVDQFVASDGTGSSYQNQFWYFGARVHAQGRGFAGFLAQRIYDTRNSTYVYDYVERTFPYTGMAWRRDVLQSDGATWIRQWYAAPNVQTLGTGYEARFFQYTSSQSDARYEAGGPLHGTRVAESTTSYTYGDGYGNPTQVTTSVTDKDPYSPFTGASWSTTVATTYSNNSSNNCLGLPTSQTTTRSVPGQVAQTRTSSYAVDSSLCRITSQVLEPASAALKVTTTLGFDGCGNISSVAVVGANPNGSRVPGRTTTFGYGARCQLPESTTNALGQSTMFAYNYTFGVPSQSTDPNTLVTSWQYDDFGRRMLETRPDGTKTAWAFESCSAGPCWGVNDLRFLAYETMSDAAGGFVRQTQRFYDGFDRLRYDEYNRVLGTWTNEIHQYDSLGRRTASYLPFASYSNGNGYKVYGYDVLDRVTSERLYLPSGALDRTTTIGYAGRTTSVTDPLGRTRSHTTDVLGRLRRVLDPSPGGTTSYDYDAFGNLNRIQDPINAVSSGTYNLRGFRTQWADADRGIWNFSGNSLNEPVAWTNAKGQYFSVVYDNLGRMTSRSELEGTSFWTWGNSAAARNIGRLSRKSGYGYSESLDYDGAGRLSRRTINSDQPYQYDYTYNAIGALDTLTYPTSPVPGGTTGSRFTIRYGYSYGAPSQITDVTQTPNRTLWTLGTANDFASPTTETLGPGVASLATGYRPATNEVATIQGGTGGSASNRQNLSYQWDTVGNLTQRQDLIQGLSEYFTPDPLNRVQSVTGNAVPNLTVSYDASGNITAKSDVGSYTYDATKKHAVSTAGTNTYQYDANGNVTDRNRITQRWASYDLPISLSGGYFYSQFSYGPDHQRWKQVANYLNGTETTHYVGGLLDKVATTSTGVTYWRHHVPTPGGATIVVSRNSDATGSTNYLLTDHLGSTDAVLNETGAYKVRESFDTFGRRRGSNWNSGTEPDWASIGNTTRDGYTGHEMLDGVGLVHMNGRVYDPAIGRFLSVDPLIGDLADSQSVNPYAYVGNRPLTFTDPSGFSAADGGGGGVGIGGGFGSNDGSPGTWKWWGNAFQSLGHRLGIGGSNAPPPPRVFAGQSAQGGTGMCGAGNTTLSCTGMVLYAGVPGAANGVPTSSWMTSSDPYARENLEQLFIDIGINAVDVLILGAYYDAKSAYDAAQQGDYGTAVVYVAFTLCDVAKPCAGLQGFKGIVRLGSGLRKAERAATTAAKSGGRLGGTAHRGTVASRAGELEQQGHTVTAGGGRLPERSVITPEGKRRFPDISTRDPNGNPYHENVGRSTAGGDPIARERRALDDIRRATGTEPGYTPYDR